MANVTDNDLDLSDLSDEEPTYEMTFEDWVEFCNGDLLRASLFANFQSDVVVPLVLPSLPSGLRDTNLFPFRRTGRAPGLPPRAAG